MSPARRLFPLLLALGLSLSAAACAGPASDDALSSEAAASTSWTSSYAEIANARVPEKFDKVISQIDRLGPQTLPHEAKSLRKKIGELRDYVDVFAYAYPAAGAKDPWHELRRTLDTGYEEVGHFKDLFDAQGLKLAEQDPTTGAWSEGVRPEDVTYPDMQEVARRRAVVLTWKDELFARRAEHRAAIAQADTQRMHEHRKLSRFFWGGADLKPSLEKSGLQNLSALIRRLLELGSDDYVAAAQIVEVTELAQHEQFHDLRKRIRSVLKVLDYFPELADASAKPSMELLDEFVERYGKLNDEIGALGLLTDPAKRAEQERAIRDEWQALRAWQEGAHVHETIATLRSHVVTRE
jgi:CHAD domain-containing protein